MPDIDIKETKMRKVTTVAVLIGALAALPAYGFAQASPTLAKQSTQKPAAASTKPAASHSTNGVVKSVDATTLVISKSGKAAEDMTFMLDPSTTKAGTIEPGANVSVRYHTDGKMNMATAVTAKPAAAPKKK
jgi:hypothetical protein